MTIEEYTTEYLTSSGQLIGMMASLEIAMSMVIALHFCGDPEKADDLWALINEKAFEQKKSILQQVINKSYSFVIEDHPALFTDITEMQTIRNRFAHSVMSIPNNLEQLLVIESLHMTKLGKFGNERKVLHTYDMKNHSTNLNLINEISTSFIRLAQGTYKKKTK